MTDRNPNSATAKPGAFDGIVWGGLLAGTLDAAEGVAGFAFKGMSPIQVLQYIASGLLGVPSFQGGLKTAALGASLRLSTLHVHAVKWGLTHGVTVYLVINYVVSPLSAVLESRS